MNNKPIILFQPVTPHAELPLKNIVQLAHEENKLFEHRSRYGGKGAAQISMYVGTGWDSRVNELQHLNALSKVCDLIHIHLGIDLELLEHTLRYGRITVKELLNSVFNSLRTILDRSEMTTLLITGIEHQLVIDHLASVWVVETVTTIGTDPTIQQKVSAIHVKRTIGEFDEQQAIDFNS